MKKSFAEITNELRLREQTHNFVARDEFKFEVNFLSLAKEFLNKCRDTHRKKIDEDIKNSREVNDPKLFKKITDVLWEFRPRHENTQYRL